MVALAAIARASVSEGPPLIRSKRTRRSSTPSSFGNLSSRCDILNGMQMLWPPGLAAFGLCRSLNPTMRIRRRDVKFLTRTARENTHSVRQFGKWPRSPDLRLGVYITAAMTTHSTLQRSPSPRLPNVESQPSGTRCPRFHSRRAQLHGSKR